jgi:hypothetical protein
MELHRSWIEATRKHRPRHRNLEQTKGNRNDTQRHAGTTHKETNTRNYSHTPCAGKTADFLIRRAMVKHAKKDGTGASKDEAVTH